MGFANANKTEAASWASAVFVAGLLVGLFMRHRIAIKQLADKDDEIDEPEKRPTQADMGAAIAVMDAEIAELKNVLECEKDGGFDLSSLMPDQKRLSA